MKAPTKAQLVHRARLKIMDANRVLSVHGSRPNSPKAKLARRIILESQQCIEANS